MQTEKPRAYTEREAINIILDHVIHLEQYWGELAGKTTEEKLSGLVFSIFSMMDGSTMDIPGIDLVMCPHPTDREYHIEKGENYFKRGMRISTAMHEEYCRRLREREEAKNAK